MITKTEKRKVVQEFNVYIAEDGTKFESEVECLNYEKKLNKDAILKKFNDILVYGFWTDDFGLCETETYVCFLKSEEDFETILDWCENSGFAVDFLAKPLNYPTRFSFTVEQSGCAVDEGKDFLEKERSALVVLDALKYMEVDWA